MYIPDYGKEIYEELSKLVDIKFKAQIKNSGIELKKLLHIEDLVTKDNFYLLKIDETSIAFVNKEDFIKKIIIYLNMSIKSLEQKFDDLQEESKSRFRDSNTIFCENEYLGTCT